MRIPSSTYRVQFNLNFRFSDAEALVPYLHDLGISDVYASPRFKARRGSSHGYDVADPMCINSELGTEEEFDRLVARLQQYGMGLLLDIVPNHMAASEENPWWADVLENGRESPYARFFDIDWEPKGLKVETLEKGRVVLPVLGEPYSDVLRRHGIRLHLDDRGFSFQYEDHRFPLSPRNYQDVLQFCVRKSNAADESPQAQLETLCVLSQSLTGPNAADDAPFDQRQSIFDFKAMLWRLYQSEHEIRRVIDEALGIFNTQQPDSLSLLHGLLSRQAYRLAHWRLAPYEVNYRRFFDINDLVGLRTEDPLVFAARHSSLMLLLQEGKVSGLRVDHIDGLQDPLEYLERLSAIPTPSGRQSGERSNVYTVVEKITCGQERLPLHWPVMGTTGYDFLNASNALFIDRQGYREIEENYRRFAGISHPFAEEWYQGKKRAMEELFAADMDLLSWRLGAIAALDPEGADVPVRELVAGLKEITACLPVYRTYYRADAVLSDEDRIALERALSDAQRRSAETIAPPVFAFLRKVLWAELSLGDSEVQKAWIRFIARWQQFTGAVMAKGLEDTALFTHHSLISINEVGNNPFHEQICFEPAAFHEFNSDTSRRCSHTMNATSTHDTKWSEDVRARINALSEMPREWGRHLRRWSRMNKRFKAMADGKLVPTPNEEVLFYQAILGIWPLEPPGRVDRRSLQMRLEEFLIKAAREAKTDTGWFTPNEKHESALRKFVSSILTAPRGDAFFLDFLGLHRELAFFGACNACSQLVLKITAPGVPDFYQGNEIWNPSLTDPDNRQAVDFRSRMTMLGKIKARSEHRDAAWFSDLLANWVDGRLKLYLTASLLNFRRSHQELFARGSYLPLAVRGTHERSVFAFARAFEGEWLMVVVPRLLKKVASSGEFPLGAKWSTTAVEMLPPIPAQWQNVLTGERIRLGNEEEARVSLLLNHFPFAVFVSRHGA